MADYIAYTKTNYFQVTNEDEFRKLVSKISCNDNIEIVVTEENGVKQFSLCAYGSFYGLIDEEDFDKMCEEFQKLLPDGEVLAIYEVGHEKLRYVSGSVTVITNKIFKTKSLSNLANNIAKDITNNPNFEL